MIRFYMDVHVPMAITGALLDMGIDVLTAQDDGAGMLEDGVVIARASELGRVLFTQDVDFIGHASRLLNQGTDFSGVVYGHQLRVSIGQCVRELNLIARVMEPNEMMNRVEWLPLWAN